MPAGKTKRCTVTATFDPAQIGTPNPLSANGPSSPELAPLDAGNNTTEPVLDVLDRGDF
ncbi:hypothetical protein L6Q96_20575 [Candidatus Binatia bacterium]|nr:hypothetical protein [Candidatus Binatia bacterium]